MGAAHRFPKETIASVGMALSRALDELKSMSAEDFVLGRQEKFLAMGRPSGKKKK